MSKATIMRVFRGTPRNLRMLAGRLRAGELVAVPTETVYGLAANALDATACRKIFVSKGRPVSDPLIVHLRSLAQLASVAHVNDACLQLARQFWPGPLTVVLRKRDSVPDIVSAGLDSVAVRIPRHPLFRRLLKEAGIPLAAPSANPFGYISPTTVDHVVSSLGDKIKYALDGGPAEIGLESTIIDLRNPKRPILLRPGAVTRGQLEAALGCPVHAHRQPRAKARSPRALPAPGMMEKHYSPRTPLVLHETMHLEDALVSLPDEAWVFACRPKGKTPANVFWLDRRGHIGRAGKNLFATMRSLDARTYRVLHFESPRGSGLAEAIRDRLRRASAKS